MIERRLLSMWSTIAASTLCLGAGLCIFVITGLAPSDSFGDAQTNPGAVSSQETVQSQARAAASDALLHAIGMESGAPAMGAAIVRDGLVLWAGNHGYADEARTVEASSHHRYRLASVSKLYAATALLTVQERTGFDLDAPVGSVVPAWTRDGRPAVSSRQLASHTAGVNHYQDWDVAAHDPSHNYATATESVPLFADAPLLFVPGARYSYSSFGYVLLATVIEGVTGRPFPEALDSLVLAPLHLSETGVERVANLHADDVDLFRTDETGPISLEPVSQSAFHGATGLRSTPRDVARFVSAFLSGGLVSQDVVAAALVPMPLGDGTPAGEDRYSVGFGWRTGMDWDGRRVAHHAGVTPGARSIALGYPQNGLSVALLVNATWTSRMETTAELLAAPFLDTDFPGPDDCPVGRWDVEGTLGDKAESGRLEILREGPLYVARFHSEGELANRYDRTNGFQLIRVGRRRARHVFALAYPWGLARLYVTPSGTGVTVTGDIVGRTLALASSAVGGDAR
jgi:serine beta-lactamase-like protein LACTB, mitochondrial